MENALVVEKVEDTNAAGADAEVDCFVIGWSPSTGDADWGIRPLLAKESEPPMSYNICYFENDELDGYLQTALQSADDDVRREAYEKAQDLIWEESPMLFLCNDSNTWATGQNIQNVKIYADGAINMRNAKMSK